MSGRAVPRRASAALPRAGQHSLTLRAHSQPTVHPSDVWNGEGFDFSGSLDYWLVEISGLVHGVTGDLLGSGQRSIFRGMLFGMTQRDATTSQAIWSFWDATNISATDAFYGWWQADGPTAVNVTVAAAAEAPAACTFNVTRGGYAGSVRTASALSPYPTHPNHDATRAALLAAPHRIEPRSKHRRANTRPPPFSRLLDAEQRAMSAA